MDIRRQITEEFAILGHWEQVAQQVLSFALRRAQEEAGSPRASLDACLERATRGRARMCWGVSPDPLRDNDRRQAVQFQRICYGTLEFVPGYLDSHLVPSLRYQFAQILALVIALAEHQVLVQYLVHSSTLSDNLPVLAHLSERELDVLIGIVLRESEYETAIRLGITAHTVHTHRQHLYQRLDVHSAHEVIARSFALHLVSWLDLPVGSTCVAAPSPPHSGERARQVM
jgi:DNA-binding CsgD family transcriptional regulator